MEKGFFKWRSARWKLSLLLLPVGEVSHYAVHLSIFLFSLQAKMKLRVCAKKQF